MQGRKDRTQPRGPHARGGAQARVWVARGLAHPGQAWDTATRLCPCLHFHRGGTRACGVGENGTPVMSKASQALNSMTDGPDSAPVNPAVTPSRHFC